LVIDDDNDVLELIKYNLNKVKVKVAAFKSSELALKKIKSINPNAIMCDWEQSDMPGIEICRRVKQDPDISHVPFIALLYDEATVDLVEILETGVEEYFIKPLRIRNVVKRMLDILKRSDQNGFEIELEDDFVQYNDMIIDTETYKLFIDEKWVELNPQEFNLLKLFVCRPGKIYTYNQINAELNSTSYAAKSYNVDQSIQVLRDKLGKYKYNLELLYQDID